jgi:hyperosmotically inducible protein
VGDDDVAFAVAVAHRLPLNNRKTPMTIYSSTPVQCRSFGKTMLCGAVLLAALGANLGLAQAQTADTPNTEMKKTERVVSDSWITTKVKSELLASSLTKGFHVRVKTRHGVVILTGKLATQDAIDQVKSVAEKVEGVKSVDTGGLLVAAQ